MTCEVPIFGRSGQVAVALVDDEDFELVSSYRWCRNAFGYAVTRVGKRILFMHRVVMGLSYGDGQKTDHISRDKLDNRKANLRLVTQAQNCQNQGSRGGSSRFRGVYFNKQAGRWQAYATIDGKAKYLGLFDREEQAGEAAKAFRLANMTHTVESVDSH